MRKATKISRDDEMQHVNLLLYIGRYWNNAHPHTSTISSTGRETTATTWTCHRKSVKKPQVQHTIKAVHSKSSHLNRTHPPNIKTLLQEEEDWLALDAQLGKSTSTSGNIARLWVPMSTTRNQLQQDGTTLVTHKHSRKDRSRATISLATL